MSIKWFDNTPKTKTVFTANLPDYEAMSPFERRSIEVLGKKGMLPPVTTTASEVPISKIADWKGGVLQYGANIGGSIAGREIASNLGASETA